MARWTLLITRVHRIAALIVGAQLLLWVISGLFFSLRPIEEVRGDHLRHGAHEMMLAYDGPMASVSTVRAAAGADLMTLTIKPFNGKLVYIAESHFGISMHDLATGARCGAIAEDEARKIALADYAGEGKLAGVMLIEKGPRESGRGEGRPVWRADFSGKQKASFWIDAITGEIVAVRTDWWRAFDLLWGLHIMDWPGRETISSWQMKAFAFGALVMALAGTSLLIDRALKGRLFK